MKVSAKLLIILSTFNGIEFLPGQVDSIRGLIQCDWMLLIRDDGSTDGTLQYLEELRDDPKISFTQDSGLHLGVKNSYRSLLLTAATYNFDYLAFCDQDDIWFSQRFIFLNSTPLSEVPEIHIGRAELVNHIGKRIGETRLRNLEPPVTSFFRNRAIGCATVINRTLVTLMAEFAAQGEFPILHDWLAYCIASEYGQVYLHNQYWLQYRQHKNNDTGYPSSHLIRIWKAIERIRIMDRSDKAILIAKYINSQKKNEIYSSLGKSESTIVKRLFFVVRNNLFHLKYLWLQVVIFFKI